MVPLLLKTGNFILDAVFENITEDFEQKLSNIVGVLETGLFIGYNVIVEK